MTESENARGREGERARERESERERERKSEIERTHLRSFVDTRARERESEMERKNMKKRERTDRQSFVDTCEKKERENPSLVVCEHVGKRERNHGGIKRDRETEICIHTYMYGCA